MHYGIIAAGQGSRLSQEGVSLPKPLVSLNGEPMIDRLISIFTRCGAESINIIINSRMAQIREHLKGFHSSVPLNVVEGDTPSSMHSFYELSRHTGRPDKFILTTVDTIFKPEEFAAYAQAFEQAPGSVDALMGVTAFVDDEKPLYVEAGRDMRITAFTDTRTPGAGYVSGGIYGLRPAALDVLEQCIRAGVSRMRNFQRALLDGGLDVRAYPFEKIIDVDHADDILKAERMLEAGGLNKSPQCLI